MGTATITFLLKLIKRLVNSVFAGLYSPEDEGGYFIVARFFYHILKKQLSMGSQQRPHANHSYMANVDDLRLGVQHKSKKRDVTLVTVKTNCNYLFN